MKQLSKRRKAAAIVTAILAVALAITGTMAAFIYSDEETNEWGDIVTPGGNGHDDFGGGDNKDVYFENYGSAPLYVRIRLDEYMEFGTSPAKPMVKSATRNNKTSWTAHIPSAKGTPHICAPGNLETPGVDFHDYWTWKMGGTQGERYYLPTDPTNPNANQVQKGPFYTIADLATNPLLKPIPEATVVTMAQWVDDGMKIGNFWVVDSDGWAYWASPLLSKQVTGLLLNEVKLTQKPDQSYYYAINVRYYATDRDDIGSMRAGATPEGNALIDKLLGVMSLDDLLDDAIKRANEALKDAEDNPGKYTQDSIDDLTDARDDALDVKNKGSGATDTEKETAIDNINDNLPLVPSAPSNIGPASLPDGVTGSPYNAALTATSPTPVTWSIDSGSLPSGLSLNASTGEITGTPTAAGTYNFTVKATNAGGSTTKPMSIVIAAGAIAPVISTTSLPGGTVGTAYNQALALSAGTSPIAWSVDSGDLPDGLTLNTSTGVISGTPTASGTFNFTVKATNTAGSDLQVLSIAIVSGVTVPVISTTTLPNGTTTAAYNQTIALSAGTAPITWSVDSGSLPDGLTLNTSTGVISGTPTVNGTFNFEIKATNSAGSDTQALSIIIGADVLLTKTPPNPGKGFDSYNDPSDPEKTNSTMVVVSGGAVITPALRYSSIALEDILTNSSEVAGTTATAVDPALAGKIKAAANTFVAGTKTLGDAKHSVICEWFPLTMADIAALDTATSTVTFESNLPVLTTKVTLTNGAKSAVVTVTFYFTESVIYL